MIINKIEKMTLGFIVNALIISQWRNFNVALVIPQPGQGKLYSNLEGQTIISACPSEFAIISHTHTITYEMANNNWIDLVEIIL